MQTYSIQTEFCVTCFGSYLNAVIVESFEGIDGSVESENLYDTFKVGDIVKNHPVVFVERGRIATQRDKDGILIKRSYYGIESKSAN